jgi:hypothetical protein
MAIPGKVIEKAAADVLTKAGQSLVRGLERLGGAMFGEWIAKREAKAVAARLAIETTAEVERGRRLQTARHQSELQEAAHQARLQRRLVRLGAELDRQQKNLEAIALRSIELTEADPDAGAAREIDEDWIFKFAQLAQDISDKTVQELWARILSSAAINGRKPVSPALLQTMTLLDARLANDFRNFCAAISTFGFCPAHDQSHERETQDIDLFSLKELGLIDKGPVTGLYEFSDFTIEVGPVSARRLDLLQTAFLLTRRGKELSEIVFRDAVLGLTEDVEQRYLEDVAECQISQYHLIKFLPAIGDPRVLPPLVITLMHRRGVPAPEWESRIVGYSLSVRLKRLLSWASCRYEIKIEQRVPPPQL